MERFTGWTGYYTYDPRGSVNGVTDADGGLWASYRYDATGRMTFGEPEYNQIYGYNGESYNPMLELQYLRARYYDVERGNFLTEDTYLGDISDPLTLNRYNYVVSNPLNYIDPSGFVAEYLTGPSYDPDDSWKANNYPLSQTGSEKTEFPVTVVSGIKAVRELWGSVSKGVANAVNMISENVSHAVKNKVKDLMETAVKASVMIVCSDTVQLLNDVGNIIFSFIIGTVYGALEPASVLLDFLIDSGGYDSAAFELGRIVGNAAAVAAIFGMFFAGGGVISGAFMGGAMALSLGAAGTATVELAAGATVIAAKGNSIAEALNSLISEMSGTSNSGGKGTEEEGESNSYSYKNGTYEKADYHSGQTTGKKNPAPKDGQFALDNSVPIGDNTTRRVGIDSNGDFVVFDETASGTFHGHVRTWNRNNGNQGLTQAMKNALYDAGYIKSPKGTSFKLTDYVKELIGK